MDWFVSALVTGVIAFSATNLDDIVFLTGFFSQARRHWHVVVGQYLGFTALVLVSLVGFLGGQILPHAWLRLFGIAPIAIGLRKLFSNRDDESRRSATGMFSVAVVTFSNGSDNIGIYAPLFAVSDSRRLIVLVGVLYVLLALVCRRVFNSLAQSGCIHSETLGALDRTSDSYRPRDLYHLNLS